ncbi:MAG TPA: hypothetical protein DEO84_02810 [candidate division Zixibacteria bacterium]|nr:hypothetical protein [candidate division Zixibacteria bacterium]HBZ00230.1 hypothetical protein [candidate division Zixibacteria bacterium]
MKQARIIIYFILVAIVVLPISCRRKAKFNGPPTLRDMCDRSDLIVIGKAISIEKIKPKTEIPIKDYLLKLQIQILTNIKGDSDNDTINCYILSNEDFKRPQFINGEKLMAFLRYSKELKAFMPFSLLFGIKYHSEESVDICEARTLEYYKIMKQSGDISARLSDWLVRCVEDSITRGDEIYDLYNNYLDTKNEKASHNSKPEIKVVLSLQQQQRLYEAVLKTEFLTFNEFYMLEMAGDIGDERIVPLLARYLRKGEINRTIGVIESMRRICNSTKIDGCAELVMEYEASESTKPGYEGTQYRNEIVSRFLILLGNNGY